MIEDLSKPQFFLKKELIWFLRENMKIKVSDINIEEGKKFFLNIYICDELITCSDPFKIEIPSMEYIKNYIQSSIYTSTDIKILDLEQENRNLKNELTRLKDDIYNLRNELYSQSLIYKTHEKLRKNR
jgi:hypothetical protein